MVAGTDAFEAEIAPPLPRLRLAARAWWRTGAWRKTPSRRRYGEHTASGTGDAVLVWLRQVVVRECSRLLRRQAAQAAEPVADEISAATTPPDERAILAEEHAEVRRALERMPEGYQRLLRLRHGHALGEKVIAVILGLPLGTVRWRLGHGPTGRSRWPYHNGAPRPTRVSPRPASACTGARTSPPRCAQCRRGLPPSTTMAAAL